MTTFSNRQFHVFGTIYRLEQIYPALLDIGKIVLAAFVVGGLIPNSPIGIVHIIAAITISLLLYPYNDVYHSVIPAKTGIQSERSG